MSDVIIIERIGDVWQSSSLTLVKQALLLELEDLETRLEIGSEPEYQETLMKNLYEVRRDIRFIDQALDGKFDIVIIADG